MGVNKRKYLDDLESLVRFSDEISAREYPEMMGHINTARKIKAHRDLLLKAVNDLLQSDSKIPPEHKTKLSQAINYMK